jgi:hypothetical protein
LRELDIEHNIKEDARTHQKHMKFGGHGEACDGEIIRLIAPGGSFTLKGGGWTGKTYS